jgi:UDP-3-O-acyl-N-acetylglucosamine deacetylase
LKGEARWRGDPAEYRAHLATARTFGFARDLDALRARGLAAHVDNVVALDLPERGPSDPGEPIRHKLLDALGDLAPLGGPPLGKIRLEKPSHRGTRAALTQLRERFGR